eukprot:jgi/Psemu1/306428/fgenesh1_kg.257_\
MSRGYHLVVGDVKPIDSLRPTSNGGSVRKVYFSDNSTAPTTGSHRDLARAPMGALVTMTGLTAPIARRSSRKR